MDKGLIASNRQVERLVEAVESDIDKSADDRFFARLGVLVDGGYFDNSGISELRRGIRYLDRDVIPGVVHLNKDLAALASGVAVYAVHFSNDPTYACIPLGDWRASASSELLKLIRGTSFEPICRFEIEQLEEMLTSRKLGWLYGPVEAILSVRSGHAAHERHELVDEILRRDAEGLFVEFSLAKELSRKLCGKRKGGQKTCREKALVFEDDWTPQSLGTVATSQDLLFRASECEADITRSTPPPLGWTLHARDRALLNCLSANSALQARLRVDGHTRRKTEDNRDEPGYVPQGVEMPAPLPAASGPR